MAKPRPVPVWNPPSDDLLDGSQQGSEAGLAATSTPVGGHSLANSPGLPPRGYSALDDGLPVISTPVEGRSLANSPDLLPYSYSALYPGLPAVSTPVRGRSLADSPGSPPYGHSFPLNSVRDREGSTKSGGRGRCGDPTKVDRSSKTTSNKYHKAVFPGMRVPVYMHKDRKGDKRVGYGDHSGLTQSWDSERVPIMSVQCPLPGGTAVTTTTDPVQKVSWGPTSRIEASDEARELINLWREALKDAKKAKGKGKDSELDESNDATRNKSIRTKKVKKVDDDAAAPDTGFQSYGTFAVHNIPNPPRRHLIPPPPTPPETIFHRTKSVAAALSMPTLPNTHPMSVQQLVEQYRLQHAADPKTFEKETRAIKMDLMAAKVARGGTARLLLNEYTVDLASREDAELAEKWARGQERNFGISDMRSRANSMLAAAARAEHEASSASASSVSHVERRSKSSLRNIQLKLSRLDLPEHVSKITTYGSVRHQHSVKREVDDHGEKRTVKTWIEITEVFEVPHAQSLTLKDVAAAVDADAEGQDSNEEIRGGESDEEGYASSSRSLSLSSWPMGESVNAFSARGRRHYDSNETEAEALFTSLSCLDDVNSPQSITQVSGDLRALMAGLRSDGQLKVHQA
ncbi:hypothetical protein AYL99_10028 [Fonsecaea erecta]|uniref:Uncharacterized protein n=1 Tax=Fonsecaea erecta TaxID=1367422 RepID=A0A178Z8T5_9EURO|nr:hypothetical protein AYL99_10028 [Fonsecaea erecta]OAP55876.1 hypothetical protein AYL99_10028 [Fonsecaea erecta]